MEFSNLRRALRSKRRALPPLQKKSAKKKLYQQFLRFPFLKTINTIALYWAIDGEMPTDSLFSYFWQQQKNCYLPIISRSGDKVLHFAPYTKDTTLILNHFDIPEPLVEPTALVTADKIDLIFVPLVAFDKSGNRLGMGGGYYDHTLSKKKPHQRFIGIAYEFQKVKKLVPKPTDISLDGVITEHCFYLFKELSS